MYDAALEALGYRRVCSGRDFSGYGIEDGKDMFALKLDVQALSAGRRFHLAFAAPSHEAINAFHRVALETGATDDGAPGYRPQYGPSYYAAFIVDLDGHRIEAVRNTTVEPV